MEYGIEPGITVVNRTQSLRIGHVMGGFVAIVVLDILGEGTWGHCRCGGEPTQQ